MYILQLKVWSSIKLRIAKHTCDCLNYEDSIKSGKGAGEVDRISTTEFGNSVWKAWRERRNPQVFRGGLWTTSLWCLIKSNKSQIGSYESVLYSGGSFTPWSHPTTINNHTKRNYNKNNASTFRSLLTTLWTQADAVVSPFDMLIIRKRFERTIQICILLFAFSQSRPSMMRSGRVTYCFIKNTSSKSFHSRLG